MFNENCPSENVPQNSVTDNRNHCSQ